MEPEFDFNKFLRRKGWKQKDAAAALGVSMGLVGTWASKKAVPSYEKVVRLIECGITAQELLGEHLGRMLLENSQAPGIEGGKDIKSEVRDALAEILNIRLDGK